MGDLEAPHGRPALFGIVRGSGTVLPFEPGQIGARRPDLLIQPAALGIGDDAGRVLRLNLVVDERVEQELWDCQIVCVRGFRDGGLRFVVSIEIEASKAWSAN